MSAPPPQWQGPPQQGPPQGPPPARARSTGVPVWLALLIVVVIGVALVALEPTFIKKNTGTAAALPTDSVRPTPSQTISTATRPPEKKKSDVAKDPLPAGIKPSWTTHDVTVDGKSKPHGYDGFWEPVTKAQYTAWRTHLRHVGFVLTPHEKQTGGDYDLHKAHVRLLGNFDGTSVTFVYDPNGY